mgnify:FL=1
MANERWESPFPYTLAYNLFKQHFTELNRVYWAFVPAKDTIKKAAKNALPNDDADPKSFFLVKDEDDKRIAPTYTEWKTAFGDFENYTRLNMLMLLSSCFETYLRTALALSFESKPGVIIQCPDAVDGAFLLKSDINYGNANYDQYRFSSQIDGICKGSWSKRISEFQKYFGTAPCVLTDNISELDKFRTKRNSIGHYIGRDKVRYSTPIDLSPLSVSRLSHDTLLKYFKLIYDVVSELDSYLHKNFIGSYDIIKCYLGKLAAGFFTDLKPGEKARAYKKLIGAEGLPRASNEYYRNIICYCDLDTPLEACRYSAKACVAEVNRQLKDNQIQLIRDNRSVAFNNYTFNLFVRANRWRANPDYCQRCKSNTEQVEYRYSMRAIQEIVAAISQAPNSIIQTLKQQLDRRLYS